MNSCSVPEILRENVQPLLRDLKLKHTWDVQQDSTSRSSSESPTLPPHKRGFCSALIKVWSPFSLSVFFRVMWKKETAKVIKCKDCDTRLLGRSISKTAAFR
ncbi:hypothetical protein GOODEAATRI_000823 [Goodea atripinnis]|uniref:BED-type domain-containing protein n=1 Tax=Goodea atripinnis TaxID=208336 RepID=A0ABV0NQS2_9TELE